jgi:predicted transcriptional regulator
MMDIQALKIDLAQKILRTQNTTLLSIISNLFQKEVEKDWWDQLPQEVQDSIFEGIQDIGKGKVFTHDQVIQEARQKYGF